jgi:hypothetical protein
VGFWGYKAIMPQPTLNIMKTITREVKDTFSKLLALSEYIEEDNLLNDDDCDKLTTLLLEVDTLINKL